MPTQRLSNKQTCRMIAHRGLSGIEPENTMPAFVAAGNRSYFGIETDVHVTSDGQFLLIHDNSTGRVANGCDLSVEENTFDSLRAVKLADRNGTTGRIDLRCPSLAEYLQTCRRYGKKALIELKNLMKSEPIARLVHEVETLSPLSEVIFISFHADNLKELRRLLPEQKLMFLTTSFDDSVCEFLLAYRFDLDIHYAALTEETVGLLHEAGLEVNVWTCDHPETAETLIGWGVDYITTNILE